MYVSHIRIMGMLQYHYLEHLQYQAINSTLPLLNDRAGIACKNDLLKPTKPSTDARIPLRLHPASHILQLRLKC